MILGLRFLLIGLGLAIYVSTRLLVPVYRSRPEILLEPSSLLVPPGLLGLTSLALVAFAALTLVEVWLRRRAGLTYRQGLALSLHSSQPLLLLAVFGLLFFPGVRFVPMLIWWLVLDGGKGLVSLAVLATAYSKLHFVRGYLGSWSERGGGAASFGIALFLVLVVLTPQRRFTQAYDERWGTGDEPRYIRIAASLLHDQDADVSNAADRVGRPAQVLSFFKGVLTWPHSALLALVQPPPGSAHPLGGQVIEGRDGGTYYVYLPGFPLLLTPAMALDSWLFPGRLPLVVGMCLVLAVLLSLALARLVEPVLASRGASLLLGGGLTLAVPLFFSAFQVYPETTAALSLALMLRVVLFSSPGWRSAFLFGLPAAILPWLNVRYLPIWGASLVAFGWVAWRARWERRLTVAAVGLPLLSLALHCLYVFHISGSFLPDALWVLNGFPRGMQLFHPETPRGLYYLLLGRDEGLLVYAPFFALALPGAFALRRRSTFAIVVTTAIFVLYLLAAASHEAGGAGGWSQPARYFVVLAPVLALWLGAWLAEPGGTGRRWAVMVAGLTVSVLMAQAMLAESNWVYDRQAFLAGGVIDPSPLLGLAYPILLTSALVLLRLWKRASSLALGTLFVLTLAVADIRTPSEAWVARGSREQTRPLLVRPGRPLAVSWTSCESKGFELALSPVGEGAPISMRVRGPGFHREVAATTGLPMRLSPHPAPVSRFGSRGKRELIHWVEVGLDQRIGRPVEVEISCR